MPYPLSLPPGIRAEGHAIVSVDGMIADADGLMPEALRNDADWRAFQAALDAAALVVVGRLGHQRHPNPGRPRLVFTRGVTGYLPDPNDPKALLFNPDTAPLAAALDVLGVRAGTLAVTGGTGVFDAFLPLYDRFILAETQELVIPGGRPCFTAGHPRSELAAAGLAPKGFDIIDSRAGVTSTDWRRSQQDS